MVVVNVKGLVARRSPAERAQSFLRFHHGFVGRRRQPVVLQSRLVSQALTTLGRQSVRLGLGLAVASDDNPVAASGALLSTIRVSGLCVYAVEDRRHLTVDNVTLPGLCIVRVAQALRAVRPPATNYSATDAVLKSFTDLTGVT